MEKTTLKNFRKNNMPAQPSVCQFLFLFLYVRFLYLVKILKKEVNCVNQFLRRKTGCGVDVNAVWSPSLVQMGIDKVFLAEKGFYAKEKKLKRKNIKNT